MIPKKIVLTSAYLAPIEFYSKLYSYENVCIEQYDHYVKQTYRNRCVIAAPGGPLTLTIPVSLNTTGKTPMRDVRISDHGKWRHLHWMALVSAYENSPYFEFYADDFRPFYEKRYDFLFDFNNELQVKICELIGIQPMIEHTFEYMEQGLEGVDDYREIIHPKRDSAENTNFFPKEYYQVFGHRHGFLPNMSIVDLLFNMGPESLLILRDSVK